MEPTRDQDDRYLTLHDLAEYAGLSVRTLTRYLTHEPPLPHYKVGNRILVRRSEFDTWIQQVGTPDHIKRARTRQDQIDQAVRGILGR
jgi:excisionase family DNA binding protein